MQQFISHSYARMVLILANRNNPYGGTLVPPYRMSMQVSYRAPNLVPSISHLNVQTSYQQFVGLGGETVTGVWR